MLGYWLIYKSCTVKIWIATMQPVISIIMIDLHIKLVGLDIIPYCCPCFTYALVRLPFVCFQACPWSGPK